MSRMIGTVSMGVRAPIIREGDNLVEIVTNCILEAMKEDGLQPRDRDICAMTEAIVARAQGNYCSVDNIADDVRAKLGGETIGVIFPILSRNRFAICLRGIAKGAKKVVLMLSYPSDEVGNHLVDMDLIDEKGVNPYSDVLTLERYRELFGYIKHPFTGAFMISSRPHTRSAPAAHSRRLVRARVWMSQLSTFLVYLRIARGSLAKTTSTSAPISRIRLA